MGENVINDEMRMFNCSCDEDAALIPLNFDEIGQRLSKLDAGTRKLIEDDITRLQLMF